MPKYKAEIVLTRRMTVVEEAEDMDDLDKILNQKCDSGEYADQIDLDYDYEDLDVHYVQELKEKDE